MLLVVRNSYGLYIRADRLACNDQYHFRQNLELELDISEHAPDARTHQNLPKKIGRFPDMGSAGRACGTAVRQDASSSSAGSAAAAQAPSHS